MVERNMYSTWTDIGYKGPGENSTGSSESTNFLYNDGVEKATSITTAKEKALTIDNKTKLNDCSAHATAGAGTWSVNIVAASSADDGAVTYTADASDAKCKALTPSFSDIGGFKKKTNEDKP